MTANTPLVRETIETKREQKKEGKEKQSNTTRALEENRKGHLFFFWEWKYILLVTVPQTKHTQT